MKTNDFARIRQRAWIILVILVITMVGSAAKLDPSNYIKPSEGDTHYCFGLNPKCMNVEFSLCNPTTSLIAIDPAKMSVYGAEVTKFGLQQVYTSTVD